MSSSVKGADPPPAEHSAAAEHGVTWSCPELLLITNLTIIFYVSMTPLFFLFSC